ncbi:helix-turn-helix domain-containing protein [Kordia sp. SMS9]|uniref:helix-turn-helix domain-containing protein n=1 Tax=Kordia sp. SMS9 TaxID=2282170 RepID=UPI0013B370E0|nr:helix-turn-helix domain-containing protein [Kordia sp. SMS9]
MFAQEASFRIPDSLTDKTNAELVSSIRKHRYSKPQIAKIYTEVYHKKATSEKNQKSIIDSYFYFAFLADVQGKFTESVGLINKGISKATTEKDSILIRFYNLRGKAHGQYGKYADAAADFNMALQISQKYHERKGENIAKINIALLQMETKQYHESLKTYHEMFRISEDSTLISENSRNSIIIGISDNFLRTKQLDSARFYLDLGLKESAANNDEESLSYLYPFDALYYYHRGDIPKSLEILKKAKEAILSLQEHDTRNIQVYYYMAQCHFALKEYNAAIRDIENAFEIIRQENDKKAISVSEKDQFIPYEYLYMLETLMYCYEKLGDAEKRDEYYTKYYPLKLESLEKDVRIHQLIFNFQQAPQIEFIKKMSQKEGVAQKKVTYLYYVVALLLVGIVVSSIFYKRREQQKQIAYKTLIEKVSVLETKNEHREEPKSVSEKKTVSITDEKAQAILKGLKKFEAQELYLDSGCNLRFVAKKVKTNATYLSKIINAHKEISFNEYINNLRIQYTLKRLKSDTLFRAYSIKSISEEVGYKSADSFTKHFKNQTSLYPSYYIKKLNQEHV